MQVLFLLLSIVAGIAGFVCWIIILIDAFQDAIWKGVLSLLCGFYLLYCALFDFEHENKWLIVAVAFFSSGISAGLLTLARPGTAPG